MGRQHVAHAHRVLDYRVRMKSGKTAAFRPAIVAHRGPILFLVEPCPSYRSGTVQRHRRFLEQHSSEIVFVLAAPGSVAARLPHDCYDELYSDQEVVTLVTRIREQDPRGALAPFRKGPPLKADS
jgi:hypothetical protein